MLIVGELPLSFEKKKKTGFVTHRVFVVFGEFNVVEFSVKVENSSQKILSVDCRPSFGRQISLCFGLSVDRVSTNNMSATCFVLVDFGEIVFFRFMRKQKLRGSLKREKKQEQSYPVNNLDVRKVVLKFLSAFILLFQQSLPSLPANDVIPSHDRAPSCRVFWYGSQR